MRTAIRSTDGLGIMQITGTCTIEIAGESKRKFDDKTLRAIKNKLTEEFSNVLDSLLYQEYGLENEAIHSCIVDDLDVDA